MNVGRLISGVVVLGYAAFAYWGGGAVGVFLGWVLFVLAAGWLGSLFWVEGG